jgi:hypothetical protein
MADTYLAMFTGIDAAEQQAFVATLQKIHANIRKNDV